MIEAGLPAEVGGLAERESPFDRPWAVDVHHIAPAQQPSTDVS